jgi:hypothetical protein
MNGLVELSVVTIANDPSASLSSGALSPNVRLAPDTPMPVPALTICPDTFHVVGAGAGAGAVVTGVTGVAVGAGDGAPPQPVSMTTNSGPSLRTCARYFMR